MSSADENQRDRGRRLRAESTDEERKLWAHLRAKRCGGFKLRRQHPIGPIGPYFVDFCCVAQHLVIELDGSQHTEPEEERKDVLRTAYLNQQGYRVLRFWNEQIETELQGVLQAIYAALTDS
jgi:very-short-patch-repair endonuclease